MPARSRLNLIAALALLYAGCGAQVDQPAEPFGTLDPTDPMEGPTATLHPSITAGPISPTPTNWDYGQEGVLPPAQNNLLNAVVADLAERLGIEFSQVQVVDIQPIVWGDSSLGCPEAGLAYAQVETEGYRLTLAAVGESYDYHTDQQEVYVLCLDNLPQQPVMHQ